MVITAMNKGDSVSEQRMETSSSIVDVDGESCSWQERRKCMGDGCVAPEAGLNPSDESEMMKDWSTPPHAKPSKQTVKRRDDP